MKTRPLTIRRCPEVLHQTLKHSAAANRRSLNGETLNWLERQAGTEKVVTGAELAAALRRANRLLSKRDREQIAAGIEDARRRMNAGHLDQR